MIFGQSTTSYDFLGGAPKYSPILHKTPAEDTTRRMASLNAGDPGLYVGGGTINLQFSQEIAYPGAYQTLHRAALEAARAGNCLKSDFDLGDPLRLIMTALGGGDLGKGAPSAGTVFLDVFKDGEEPYGVAANYAMVYLIPPNGGLGFDDDAGFLAAVSHSAQNVIKTLSQFNSRLAAGTLAAVPGLEPITELRTCLFSGGAFRKQSVSPDLVAGAVFAGFEQALAGGRSGLALVEFENGQGEFAALESLQSRGGE